MLASSVRLIEKAGTLGRSALHVTSAIGVASGSVCCSFVPGYYGRNLPPLGFHRRPAGTACDRQQPRQRLLSGNLRV